MAASDKCPCNKVQLVKMSDRFRVIKKKSKRFGLPDITLQVKDTRECTRCGSITEEWVDVPVIDGE